MGILDSFVSGATGGLLGMAGSAMTNSANKEIAEMNIDYQKEANAKNESLMRESWGRDDNSVQRRSIDLQKAGMSPLLAAGAAASNSGAVSMQAPQSKQVVKQSGFEGALSGLYQGIMANQSMMSTIAQQQQEMQQQAQAQMQEAQLQTQLQIATETREDLQKNEKDNIILQGEVTKEVNAAKAQAEMTKQYMKGEQDIIKSSIDNSNI